MDDTTILSATLSDARLLHTMLRVRDLDRSLDFYVGKLGMRLQRRQDFPTGRFTLAFVGYGDEASNTAIELTHNWGEHDYTLGTAYGHIAIGVADVYLAAAALAQVGVRIVRPPGSLEGNPTEIIAFVEDPDGYRIELIAKTAGQV